MNTIIRKINKKMIKDNESCGFKKDDEHNNNNDNNKLQYLI